MSGDMQDEIVSGEDPSDIEAFATFMARAFPIHRDRGSDKVKNAELIEYVLNEYPNGFGDRKSVV